MARVLFVWELGKGYGHLAPYLHLVPALQKRGHEVVFAARDVGNTEKIFGRHAVTVHQAPIMMHNIGDPYRVQYNLSHLIHNTGFGEAESLLGLVKAWRGVYQRIEPDLAIFDHSPTALLAARGFSWPRIVSGSGFLIPPPGVPLPMMRYWQEYDQKRLLEDEQRLVAIINGVQDRVGAPPLGSMSELYAADDLFLLGFEEMDHYPQRQGGDYLGMFSPPDHGVEPEWPGGYERRLFGYLHPYRKIGELLAILSSARFASLVYAPELSAAVKKKYAGKALRFSDKPVNVDQAAAQCDFALTNATFGTMAAFLLRGTPVMCVPTNLERVMGAKRVIEMGAGLGVTQQQADRLKPALSALFRKDSYRQAAQRFRDKYAGLDLEWQTGRMIEIVDRHLGGRLAAGAGRG